MRRARTLLLLVPPLGALAFALIGGAEERGPPVATPFRDAAPLFAPKPTSGFRFAIVGDRTTGPESGIGILARAVREMNSFDPDFVMTVGDLVQGYNRGDEWLAQMRQYKQVMSALRMPWYPVPGNHDVYPSSDLHGDRGNEKRFLQNFGPLWYSFDHEFAHFIVLYSDEQLSFKNPAVDQRMSDGQLNWLADDLAKTEKPQAFVFLHHPRWNYPGDVWEPVHRVLAKSGKVRGVFAGHWHRYRSDGVRDGIRYYVMAATGATIGRLDVAGDLQHWNFVTVRPDGFTMAVLPVGHVLDQDFVTRAESDAAIALLDPAWAGPAPRLALPAAGQRPKVEIPLRNPTAQPIEVDLSWAASRGGLSIEPPARTLTLAAKAEAVAEFALVRGEGEPGFPRVAPTLSVVAKLALHGDGAPVQRVEHVLVPELEQQPPAAGFGDDETPPARERALALDGKSACAIVDAAAELQPDGPFTLECWFRPEPLATSTGLINCTEQSGFGFFLGEQRESAAPPLAAFDLFVANEGYVVAKGDPAGLAPGRWVHLAATWDGSDVRLFVGGALAADSRLEGRLRHNGLPLIVGADVDGKGRPTRFATGALDEVRLSRGLRYGPGGFTPARRFARDPDTLLLLHFDRVEGDLTPDSSGRGHHAHFAGAAYLAPADGG